MKRWKFRGRRRSSWGNRGLENGRIMCVQEVDRLCYPARENRLSYGLSPLCILDLYGRQKPGYTVFASEAILRAILCKVRTFCFNYRFPVLWWRGRFHAFHVIRDLGRCITKFTTVLSGCCIFLLPTCDLGCERFRRITVTAAQEVLEDEAPQFALFPGFDP